MGVWKMRFLSRNSNLSNTTYSLVDAVCYLITTVTLCVIYSKILSVAWVQHKKLVQEELERAKISMLRGTLPDRRSTACISYTNENVTSYYDIFVGHFSLRSCAIYTFGKSPMNNNV